MLYLLDANTLIDANRDYYPIDRVPEFWEWLVFQGNQGTIKIPTEIYEEFADFKDHDGKKDALASWWEQEEVGAALKLKEEAKQDMVAKIMYEGYIADPTDIQLKKIGRDPFLISYALRDLENRVIVTTENSEPSRIEANRKIPDVCGDFKIQCINTYQMIKDNNFSTSWNRQARRD